MMNLRFSNWMTQKVDSRIWLSTFFISSAILVVTLVLLAYPGRFNDNALVLIVAVAAALATIASTYALTSVFRADAPNRSDSAADARNDKVRVGRGMNVVAIGGGTGLPATLRGLKAYTDNITAIVTVADDGGSSGKLRRDLGILPPGDLRNNIAALADNESLMTKLFQYRFSTGDLEGHSFGNLLIAALADIAMDNADPQQNSLTVALVETQRILNIKGRVLPSTLADVAITAQVKLANSERVIKVKGESKIEEIEGQVSAITLEPERIPAYPPSVQAILDADLIVIGPGSLYTSILPNLLVPEIAAALRATDAYKIYVCNVATQPVETSGYDVADHVMAMERHVGRGTFHAVIANNVYPRLNAGITQYVSLAPKHSEIYQRYEVYYTDLTDEERPWRHDSTKLARAITDLFKPQQAMGIM
ncbi:MAG: uridine diphosphate-N-acetylglucosamine-binding protein YvcK [Anaerolineaceae bacterium]|nr:uridine diphosphate-N-acetylglucosamine-binding protein YvcK [Anaerolineaceae bacterium]